MKDIETPLQFDHRRIINASEIQYTNVMEISQGSPEVGNLSVDGRIIKGLRFGGPLIGDGKYIFAPAFERGFFGSGFRVAKIDTEDLSLQVFGKKVSLIFLDRVEDDNVYFFQDLMKQSLTFLELG